MLPSAGSISASAAPPPGHGLAVRRQNRATGGGSSPIIWSFFIFILFFLIYQKYISIFFQNCHHAAGSFGGKEIPPDEPAVGAVGPRLTAYRRLNWR